MSVAGFGPVPLVDVCSHFETLTEHASFNFKILITVGVNRPVEAASEVVRFKVVVVADHSCLKCVGKDVSMSELFDPPFLIRDEVEQ